MKLSHCMLAGAIVLATSEASAQTPEYLEFYGRNLFGGFILHRWACVTDGWTVTHADEFDGFDGNNYCSLWSPASDPSDFNEIYLGWTWMPAGHDIWTLRDVRYWVDVHYAGCWYNWLWDCNSDCWIRRFGANLGIYVPVLSPCWGF